MALGKAGSPTILGRRFEGQLKSFGIMCAWSLVWGVGLILLTGVFFSPMKWLWFESGPRMRDLFSIAPENLFGDLTFVGLVSMILLTAPLAWWLVGERHQRFTARITSDIRRHNRMAAFGRGGSAQFGGLLDEWDNLYNPGGILLGRSMFDNKVIGLDDDRGLLTIASNRSGKGRAAIIPNLLMWPGSAVVIDPKGTNAAVTAARRGQGGGRVTEPWGFAVHVIDPFQIVPGVQRAAFNPLSSIDINGITAKEEVGLVADALVVPSGDGAAHWDESARMILAGLIAHFLSTKQGATLLDVREALKQDADGLDATFEAMMGNNAAGGTPKAAASLILNAGKNERGSHMTTVLRNTSWLDSLAMAGTLGRSDFSMMELKTKPVTVYVVLPPEMLHEHARFLRLFVNQTVQAASRGGKSKVPILLIMDEFYALGTLGSLSKAAGALAGYGLRLWPIVQNVTQMRELYPQNWQTFFANAGAVQIFGVNDRETAQEVAQNLGKRAYLDTVDDRTVRVVSDLLEANEMNEQLGRDSGLQLILRSGGSPLLLRKMPYDSDPGFTRAMYSPDPDYPQS